MRTICAACVFAFFALIQAGPAHGTLVVSHMGSDEELLAILAEENVAFVAEGRIGDLSGTATFELDLGQTTTAPSVTSQHVWPSGMSESFSLTYDKVLNRVHFTVGGTTLDYSPDRLFMEIFVRAHAVMEGTSVVLSGLSLNGESVGETCAATGADGLDILRIQGGTLLDGFTLTGGVTLEWSGSPPTQSQLVFQVKVGSPDPLVSTAKTTWGQLKGRFR